jgi:hypothetical protein
LKLAAAHLHDRAVFLAKQLRGKRFIAIDRVEQSSISARASNSNLATDRVVVGQGPRSAANEQRRSSLRGLAPDFLADRRRL